MNWSEKLGQPVLWAESQRVLRCGKNGIEALPAIDRLCGQGKNGAGRAERTLPCRGRPIHFDSGMGHMGNPRHVTALQISGLTHIGCKSDLTFNLVADDIGPYRTKVGSHPSGCGRPAPFESEIACHKEEQQKRALLKIPLSNTKMDWFIRPLRKTDCRTRPLCGLVITLGTITTPDALSGRPCLLKKGWWRSLRRIRRRADLVSHQLFLVGDRPMAVEGPTLSQWRGF